jgi:hypothetical protein
VLKTSFLAVVFFLCFDSIQGQDRNIPVLTSDIDNFWTAYDSVQKLSDTTLQKQIIQTLYLDKATMGLRDFMRLRQHSASRHLKNISRYPKFWNSVRTNTLAIQQHKDEMNLIMDRFRNLYPAFRQPEVYFAIGCLNSGGTTQGERVLIGAEIAASDKNTDASELNAWLQNVFCEQQDIIFLVTHETVHIQQKNTYTKMLLPRCIKEGAADFIAEILMERKFSSPYMIYGLEHERELWEKFRSEMFENESKDWLYNGSQVDNADLGYFMGYQICKSYYDLADDKKKAIAEMLDLNFNNRTVMSNFFDKSGYALKWPSEPQ